MTGEDLVGGEAVTDLAHALGRAERRLGRRLDGAMSAHGHTAEEWRVLAVLVDGLGQPMREIAEAAAVPGPTLTGVIDRMVTTGLVDRRTDADDRRRVLVSLTSRGRALHGRLARIVEAESAVVEERFGATEMAQLTRLLQRLLARLEP